MTVWESLEQHSKQINDFRSKVNGNNNEKVFTEMYKYIKDVTNSYSALGFYHPAYISLLKELESFELDFGYQKIINVPINFEFYEEKKDFLEMVVHSVRQFLIRKHGMGPNIDINAIDYTNDCANAKEVVKAICSSEKVKCIDLPIFPGYDQKERIYGGAGFHWANIVEYNGKKYLIDVTYPQFFWLGGNNLERLGIVNFPGCSSGIFMLMSEKTKQIATTLLKDGYIELTEEILKLYLDSFTISFRNGLYYESTNDFSFTTPYTLDDYTKFLIGEDSQIKHEGRENLGFQEKPLKNPGLIFKKKM